MSSSAKPENVEMPNRVLIALGSNIGDRELMLAQAIDHISTTIGHAVNKSSIYETAAWGLEDQLPYLNQCIEVNTKLDPLPLLLSLLRIENTLGRVREVKWGPRTIDLDILLYNDQVIAVPELKVPHPYLSERRFVLVPLAEIAADLVVPQTGQTVAALLKNCPDQLDVRLYSPSEKGDYEKAGL